MDTRLFLLLTVIIGTAKAAQTTCSKENRYICKQMAKAYTVLCEDPKTCKEVQAKGIGQDGEYDLFLNGSNQRPAKIFCAGMNTSTPLEYLTLPAGQSQNFAHHFNKKTHRSELTSFDKVRLDLTDLTIIIDDHRFATTNVPGVYHDFASAADCKTWCPNGAKPQGKFQVDLTGTSFRLPQSIAYEFSCFPTQCKKLFDPFFDVSHLRWSAKCGGWCGLCFPKEIKLELNV